MEWRNWLLACWGFVIELWQARWTCGGRGPVEGLGIRKGRGTCENDQTHTLSHECIRNGQTETCARSEFEATSAWRTTPDSPDDDGETKLIYPSNVLT